MIETKEQQEKIILVAVNTGFEADAIDSLDEFVSCVLKETFIFYP